MIEWGKIDFKGKTTGEVNVICPNCSHERKPSNRKAPCLHVNMDKGVGKCHHCGDVTVKNPKKEEKVYNAPPQEWENHTKLSDAMVTWFAERGISQTTIQECRITEERYFQPAHGQECNNVVFNYFEGQHLVNKKYRSPKKKFTQIKDAKKVFYGINDVIGETECYIVEGEMDKLAMWEIGVKNCISVPNGANDLNNIFETCGAYLEGMEQIYIAVDNDEPGQKLEEELLKRFGKWRCARIEFKHGKDANDELIAGKLELEEAIKNKYRYPVDGVYGAKDIHDEFIKFYDEGFPKTIKPTNEIFKDFNQVFSMLDGQLTVVTGISSYGKSNFWEWYLLNIVHDCDKRLSFYSPEHLPIHHHQQVIIEKVIGKPFFGDQETPEGTIPRITPEEIDEFEEWAHDRIKFTANPDGKTVDWDWLFDKLRESMFTFGTDILVIDAFNKVKRKKPDSLAEINDILADLTSFCQAYNVSIVLIAHPTKMKKNEDGTYQMPGLYDVKGSGDFRDQAHNGCVVHRYFEDTTEDGTNYTRVKNLKTKFRYQGEIGGYADFQFDEVNGRFYPKGGIPNRECLYKPNKELKPNAGITPDPNAWIEPLDEIEDF